MDNKEVENFKEKINSRGLDNFNVIFATFLAGFDKFGLNQGEVFIISENAGQKLADYYRAKGISIAHNIQDIIKFFQSEFNISKDILIEEESQRITIKVYRNACRYCPVGVGGAELKGTACPFPGLIEGFVNGLLERKAFSFDKTIGLKKDEQFCIMQFNKI